MTIHQHRGQHGILDPPAQQEGAGSRIPVKDLHFKAKAVKDRDQLAVDIGLQIEPVASSRETVAGRRVVPDPPGTALSPAS